MLSLHLSFALTFYFKKLLFRTYYGCNLIVDETSDKYLISCNLCSSLISIYKKRAKNHRARSLRVVASGRNYVQIISTMQRYEVEDRN